jgi:D-alanyl-lipoteichoic acid acyltransferase DltB (MBOAT superfamily)
MLFNSWTFWIFFSIVLPVYWLLAHRAQNIFLIVVSYTFYGWWDWRFLLLIAFSTVLDFTLGNLVAGASVGPKRDWYVKFSVIVNLLLLGIFKYYNFFAKELSHMLGSLGISVSLPILEIILPVGISFYTFQSMSYVLDIARGITKPAARFVDFALYVSFFPHLVAGPIMRSGTKEHDALGRGLLKQLEAPRRYQTGDFQEGLYHIILGLFKKIVIGDNMATIVNMVFAANPVELSGPECLAAIFAFAWQIYADFSGYSSIAQGIAKWMGIDLMVNFRMPYLAQDPSDFWRRWHISLSTWLRDYLYIPLGGSRGGRWLTYRNLLITMILGGVWHGANWTFVLWGLFHGFLLCGYRFLSGKVKPDRRLMGLLSSAWRIMLMFNLVSIGWLLFRAESVTQATHFAQRIITDWHMTPLALSMFGLLLFYVGPLFLYEIWVEYRQQLTALLETTWIPRTLVYTYYTLMLIFFPSPVVHEFIYFQF